MRHTLSRVLASVELAAFLIPALYRAVLGVVLLRLDPFGTSTFPVIPFVLLLIAIAAMAGLWRILSSFILNGSTCFQGIDRAWWWLSSASAAMVLAALPIRHGSKTNQPFLFFADDRLSGLCVCCGIYGALSGYTGLYLLIPFAHVLIERQRQVR
jgi:hypothetical protein